MSRLIDYRAIALTFGALVGVSLLVVGFAQLISPKPVQRPSGYVVEGVGRVRFVATCSNHETALASTCQCVFTALSRAYGYEWWNDKVLTRRLVEDGYNGDEIRSVRDTCLIKGSK